MRTFMTISQDKRTGLYRKRKITENHRFDVWKQWNNFYPTEKLLDVWEVNENKR